MKKKSFTILELIIVIIIIGILAALALPNLWKSIEFSRSAEALAAFSAIRGSLERCALMSGKGHYKDCIPPWPDGTDFSSLDIDNPGDAPGAHFRYIINGYAAAGYESQYSITAIRNARNGGIEMFSNPEQQNYITLVYRPVACPKNPISYVAPERSAFYPLFSFSNDNCF